VCVVEVSLVVIVEDFIGLFCRLEADFGLDTLVLCDLIRVVC
jgi:hypothetical protein